MAFPPLRVHGTRTPDKPSGMPHAIASPYERLIPGCAPEPNVVLGVGRTADHRCLIHHVAHRSVLTAADDPSAAAR